MANLPQRIYELADLNKIKNNALLLVCQDNLTKKISIEKLRDSFIGDDDDNDTSNKFYSVDKINAKIKALQSNIDAIGNSVKSIDNKITVTRNELLEEINTIYTKITNINTSLSTEKIGLIIQPVGSSYRTYDDDINPSVLFGGVWDFIGTEQQFIKGSTQIDKYVYVWERKS